MLPVFSSLFLLHFRNPHAYYLELENQTFFFFPAVHVFLLKKVAL